MERVTIDLPPAFYDDHRDRDLPSGTEVKRTKRYVRVEMDAATWAELLSDARHYSADFDPQFVGLMSSARATAKRLLAAEVPWTEAEAAAAAEAAEDAALAEPKPPLLDRLAAVKGLSAAGYKALAKRRKGGG